MAVMVYIPLYAFMNAFLVLPVALAVPWIGAIPTPAAGINAMNGMSPRPTEPPGAGNIPRELLKRGGQVVFPPPINWCGFVTGDFNNPLSCRRATDTCSFSQDLLACCNPPLNPCTWRTLCIEATSGCSDCTSDDILYCSSPSSSSCGINLIRGSSTTHTDFMCTDTRGVTVEIEHLADLYITAIGSTIVEHEYSSSAFASTTTESPTDSGASTTSASSASASVSPKTTMAAPHKGLAVGAIAGIAVGAGCIALAALFGIIFCCIMQKRRRNRAASQQTKPPPHAAFNHNIPMQQAFPDQAAYPNTAQSVQYPPSNPGVLNEPPQYPVSPQTSTFPSTYNGQSSPMKSPLLSPNRLSSVSPPPLPHNHSATMDDVKTNSQAYPLPPKSPIAIDTGGMGAKIGGHAAANDHQVYEVPAESTHVQGQNQAQTQGWGQDTVHEVPAQPEPKYTAYSPTFSTQHESSYTTYTRSSIPELSSTQSNTIPTQTSTHESLSGQQFSPGIWELPEQRRPH